MEGVDVLKSREAVEDCLELFAKRLGCELDFSSIEACGGQITVPWGPSFCHSPRILLILKPDRIWVGSFRCVRERTMSMNSCEVGTGAISFHVVFILSSNPVGGRLGQSKDCKTPPSATNPQNLAGEILAFLSIKIATVECDVPNTQVSRMTSTRQQTLKVD
jgi:hypothetical protein